MTPGPERPVQAGLHGAGTSTARPVVDGLRALFEVGLHPLEPRQAGRPKPLEPGVVTEELWFETALGEPVRGVLARPEAAKTRRPAILCIHAHGDRYDIGAAELLNGRPALRGPLGPVLARMGFVALAIDMPGFGSRAGVRESALAKARLWRGRSLAGQMVGELHAALGWLAGRDDVDAGRIGAFGISMGATLGYWLAAVDARLSCLVHQCCFADFETLIELGAHDLHGIYLTVPGLIGLAGNGEIAGLVAPRPQLVCIGDRDPLTPPPAVDRALAQARAAYASAGAPERLLVHREKATGHEESAEMRGAALDFFRRFLA